MHACVVEFFKRAELRARIITKKCASPVWVACMHLSLSLCPDDALLLPSRYVYVAETDHVLMKPLPNLASESEAAAHSFGYMQGRTWCTPTPCTYP